MTTHTDLAAQEQAAFEKWARPITATAMENGRYVEVMTSLAWEAWQARAALKSQPDAAQGVPEGWLDLIAPRIDPAGLDEEKHHCEHALYLERERLHREFAALAATPKPQEQAAQVVAVPGGEPVAWVDAVQSFADELELPFREAKAFLDEVFPQWMADKEAAGFVTLRRDDLIEGDSYGVDGSDFYRCRICHSESGAGMLNNGIKHEADCPLHATPQPASEPVAWRWSESGGVRWFDWTPDWTHHDKAKQMGCLIEYATPQPAAKPAQAERVAQDSELLAWIEKVGSVHIQRVRAGFKGPIRWDIEYGPHEDEARGDTLEAAIRAARTRGEGSGT